uniref:Uncharacterized protein n=1 Tax=Lactuca sativa TaxID=4236 RepID=A0A9R1WTZ5_LACSA|nr:hypothetical protein LSAT_V11C900468950 [Lactuca sativa]
MVSETLYLVALLHSRTIEESLDNFLVATAIPRVSGYNDSCLHYTSIPLVSLEQNNKKCVYKVKGIFVFWDMFLSYENFYNLIRYGNHALTYKIFDRIFSQVLRKFKIEVEGKMGYEDFVYFILSEEDKSSGPRLEYWFKCIDLDGNGNSCIGWNAWLKSLFFFRTFYVNAYFTLQDLKGSKLSGSFFNILFNLHMFMAFESRDPFLIR